MPITIKDSYKNNVKITNPTLKIANEDEEINKNNIIGYFKK